MCVVLEDDVVFDDVYVDVFSMKSSFTTTTTTMMKFLFKDVDVVECVVRDKKKVDVWVEFDV